MTQTGAAIPERGIITYSLSSNRQNVLAGAAHAAVFNTWRRFAGQVLFWVPPLVAAYYAMEWANKRQVMASVFYLCLLPPFHTIAMSRVRSGDRKTTKASSNGNC